MSLSTPRTASSPCEVSNAACEVRSTPPAMSLAGAERCSWQMRSGTPQVPHAGPATTLDVVADTSQYSEPQPRPGRVARPLHAGRTGTGMPRSLPSSSAVPGCCSGCRCRSSAALVFAVLIALPLSPVRCSSRGPAQAGEQGHRRGRRDAAPRQGRPALRNLRGDASSACDQRAAQHDWVDEAIPARSRQERQRSADTHLLGFRCRGRRRSQLYLKDESSRIQQRPEAPARAVAVPLRALVGGWTPEQQW